LGCEQRKQSDSYRLPDHQSKLQSVRSHQLRDRVGLCQWFHYEAYTDLKRTIALLQDLGIRHLRTGISWADYLRPNGQAWYDWQMQQLHAAGFHILLSVWHTPPSLAEGGKSNHPPRRLRDYADFIDLVITRYGHQFAELELWNEPNNRYKWNFVEHDPDWRKFANMLVDAAYWAKALGKTTVLGGMSPVDHHWLDRLRAYHALEHIDIISIHAFPEMWWDDAPNWEWYSHWRGWRHKLAYITQHAEGRPVWVTETGLATWDMTTEAPGHYHLQVEQLEKALTAPVERLYWYSAVDLAPYRAAIEGFHVDENEYHMGLVSWGGKKKPAYRRLRELLQERPAKAISNCDKRQENTLDPL
jgi:CDP-paratose 2-epimerase